MTTEELAKFYALLTILEPQAQTCVQAARLAEAGTAGEGDTDTTVVKQLKAHADKIAAELASVSPEKLQRKTAAIAKFLG
ncbi:hypothetical protein ACIG5E_16820 [Kitasatospora sp. NPDC053057]|uniref:hypothetical protein n=1 Tax=Kitasatospora sp. NPDC053057 TaxID=3364062 RepID=UPI0037C6D5C7